MAAEDIKRSTLYINSAKLAELESSDFTSKTNGDRMHGQDGVIGISQGNIEVDISAKIIRLYIPKAAQLAMEAAHISQEYVSVSYKIGTVLWNMDCRITDLAFNSESRSGSNKGTVTLMSAGNPSIA